MGRTPPDGFADRVLARVRPEHAEPGGDESRQRWLGAATVAVIALAVRPEKMRLSATPPDAGIAIAATVASINYQGGVSIVHLTAASGHALKAEMPSAAAAVFERGTPVWAGWDPADSVVLGR